jgi:hypothetical protein
MGNLKQEDERFLKKTFFYPRRESPNWKKWTLSGFAPNPWPPAG